MWSRQEQQPVHTMVSGGEEQKEESGDIELLSVTWLGSHRRTWLDCQLWPLHLRPLLRLFPVSFLPLCYRQGLVFMPGAECVVKDNVNIT